MRQYLLPLMLLCTSATVWADDTLPVNCKPIAPISDHQNIILNNKSKTEKVYFLNNTSNYSLMIDHPHKNGAAQAGWSSDLAPGNWSAIFISDRKFAVNCHTMDQDKFKQVDCSKLIRVCESDQKLANQSLGNYWVLENKSLAELTSTLNNP